MYYVAKWAQTVYSATCVSTDEGLCSLIEKHEEIKKGSIHS